jgi:hypothetical protein
MKLGKKLEVIPEVMPSSGGAPASELANSTQSSKVNDIELLFREAIQNSHDQRMDQKKTVDFFIEISKIQKSERELLSETIAPVQNSPHFLKLRELIKSPGNLYLLSFTDTHTKGLNGPTDASLASKEKNFVNFFHKVGRDSQSDSDAGGSFGHGRAVFFNSSKVATALVFTRFESEGKFISRFYGMTLDDSFNDGKREYTGKWLWGKSGENKADSYTGTDADELAKAFGIFDNLSSTTGTSIAIIAPKYIENDSDAQKYAGTLEYAAEKSIWPHLMKNETGFQSISVAINVPGISPILVSVEKESSKAFKYVKAYRESLLKENSVRRKPIRTTTGVELVRNKKSFSLSPQDVLGHLYWTRRMLFDSTAASPEKDSKQDLVGLPDEFVNLSGVAIFRSPRLVVEYIDPPFPQNDFEIVGYFEASSKANPFLRASEADTHDEWIDTKLQQILGKGKTNPVKRIMSQIEEDLKTLLPKENASESTMEVGLMNDLGAFLSFEGKGVSGPKKPKPGSGTGTGGGVGSNGSPLKVTPLSINGEHKGFHGDRAIGHFRYEISRSSYLEDGKIYEISFIPRVALKGGYEELKPGDYDEAPEVTKILTPDGTLNQNKFISQPNEPLKTITVVIETPRNLNVASQFVVSEAQTS